MFAARNIIKEKKYPVLYMLHEYYAVNQWSIYGYGRYFG